MQRFEELVLNRVASRDGRQLTRWRLETNIRDADNFFGSNEPYAVGAAIQHHATVNRELLLDHLLLLEFDLVFESLSAGIEGNVVISRKTERSKPCQATGKGADDVEHTRFPEAFLPTIRFLARGAAPPASIPGGCRRVGISYGL